jgi:hypothetical protein
VPSLSNVRIFPRPSAISHRNLITCHRTNTGELQTSLLQLIIVPGSFSTMAFTLYSLGKGIYKSMKDHRDSTSPANNQQQIPQQYSSSSHNNQFAASNAAEQTSEEPPPPYQQYAPAEPQQQPRARSESTYMAQRDAAPEYQRSPTQNYMPAEPRYQP